MDPYSQPNSSFYPPAENPPNLEFQSFSYGQNQPPQYGTPPPTYSHSSFDGRVTLQSIRQAFSTGLPDEPPLLEEMGINFSHIRTKGMSVLNPFRSMDRHIMDDTDLAGPIVFCFLFGTISLLTGKLYFGYVYGVSVLACMAMYSILNLMSESGIDMYRTASVLGYCLLPMVIMCSFCALLSVSGMDKEGYIQMILAIMSVVWCTLSASLMYVTVLSMSEQRALVAYPAGLVYSAFAILAIYPLSTPSAK